MAQDWRDTLRDLIPGTAPAEPETTEPSAADISGHLRLTAPLKVSVERKGRAGKTATIVYGFPDTWPHSAIDTIAGDLRRRLGTGGSARGGEILLQGDRGKATVETLADLGYKARLC